MTITAEEIRSEFLRFFEERGHLVVPSSSLIPASDPSLLLTNAGMVQFKPYYTGDEIPSNPRLTSIQKCFRTTDIDAVGDLSHNTFFEMLGNFSIGDYFKREAIFWAWEFLTKNLAIPPERLWITIFLDDDEAFGIWAEEIGIPSDRIVRLGEEDNFWGPAGAEGPCGPCSEIHFDYGEQYAPGCKVGDENSGDRFLEIWNLVFVQFYQSIQGERTLLPAPSIDTGMGLERITAVMQSVNSAYETDLLRPVVRTIENLTSVVYGVDVKTDYAIRVIAEHTRAALFLIADGVTPSNEARGYVLRRLIRRALRYARQVNAPSETMISVAESIIEIMSPHYGELNERSSFVIETLKQEEGRFSQALAQGLPILEGFLIPLRDSSNEEIQFQVQSLSDRISDGVKTSILDQIESKEGIEKFRLFISGPEAFYLFDSFGFPLELTIELAKEHGMGVDIASFEVEMETQRERGRAAAGSFLTDREDLRKYEELTALAVNFQGYEKLEINSQVEGLLADGVPVLSITEGKIGELITSDTCFYPEGGGQVGDVGWIEGEGYSGIVTDTKRPLPGLIVHDIQVTRGTLKKNDLIQMGVEVQRRQDTARNHTATHMLHAALRGVLGAHVRQAGSLVTPDRLRFDFTHFRPLTTEQISEIQYLVNGRIRADLLCEKSEIAYKEALEKGALAFFGDRYPENVRTLQIGNGDEEFSYEVCGGTHVNRTGQIGLFHITSESGLGTGIRRLEAVTGSGADRWLEGQLNLLSKVTEKLSSNPNEIMGKLENLLLEVDQSRRQSMNQQKELSRDEAEKLLLETRVINGISIVKGIANTPDIETMRKIGDLIRDKIKSGIVILGSLINGKPFLIIMVSKDWVEKGYSASEIVKTASKIIGGGGGGRSDVAQAGGKDAALLANALDEAEKLISG